MKGVYVLLISILLFGFAGCERKMTMKIYGDSPLLDTELHHLSEKYEAVGRPIVVASKYEKPDLIIVNGVEAISEILKLYNVELKLPDSLGWNIQKKTIDSKQIICIVGTSTATTKNGIHFFTLTIDDSASLKME